MAVEELRSFKRLAANRTKVLPCGGIRDTSPENRDNTRNPESIRLSGRCYFAAATAFAITT